MLKGFYKATEQLSYRTASRAELPSQDFSCDISPMFFHMPPDLRLKEYEILLKSRNKNDKDRPPSRRPGDGYRIGGALAGVLIGGFLARNSGNALLIVGGIVIGGIIGTILASFVLVLIKKLKQPKENRPQGPFV